MTDIYDLAPEADDTPFIGGPGGEDVFLGPGSETPEEPDDIEDHTDFDAFWKKEAKAAPKPSTVTIMGDRITLPRALPLHFVLEQTRQQRLPKKQQDPMALAVILFGQVQVNKWARAGMDTDQFAVVISWVPAKLQGSDVTLEEVAQKLKEYQAGQGEESGEG